MEKGLVGIAAKKAPRVKGGLSQGQTNGRDGSSIKYRNPGKRGVDRGSCTNLGGTATNRFRKQGKGLGQSPQRTGISNGEKG